MDFHTLHIIGGQLARLSTVGAEVMTFGSEIFTVSAILWTFNFLANSIERVYRAGYHFGSFYRRHLHHLIVKFIALLITLVVLIYEISDHLWVYRNEYLAKANVVREQIGSLFVYRSPVIV